MSVCVCGTGVKATTTDLAMVRTTTFEGLVESLRFKAKRSSQLRVDHFIVSL